MQRVQETISITSAGELDDPAKLVGAQLGPWSCLRQCDNDNTGSFYSHVRRYGHGAVVPLMDDALEAVRFRDSICLTGRTLYNLSRPGHCSDPKDCPDWMAALDGGLPSFNCSQEKCSAGPWSCVQSQGDKSHFVFARLTCDGKVQCLGPNSTKCTWYTDNLCTMNAIGEPDPDLSLEIGMVCTQTEEGWCRDARDALTRGGELPVPKCCSWTSPPISTTKTTKTQTTPLATSTAIQPTSSPPTFQTATRAPLIPSGAAALSSNNLRVLIKLVTLICLGIYV